MEIVEISQEKINDINGLDAPFEVIGKINPILVNEEWSYTEELFAHSHLQSYRNPSGWQRAYRSVLQ